MSYRDRPLLCPRCSVELVRREQRDHWRCTRCQGLLLEVAEVVREMLTVAPELMPDDGARVLTTIGRRTKEPTAPCALCGDGMEPVFLGGVPVERCYHDELVWLDAGELERVLVRAKAQGGEVSAQKSWFLRIHEWLFPDQR